VFCMSLHTPSIFVARIRAQSRDRDSDHFKDHPVHVMLTSRRTESKTSRIRRSRRPRRNVPAKAVYKIVIHECRFVCARHPHTRGTAAGESSLGTTSFTCETARPIGAG